MRLRKLELKDAPLMLEWMHDKSVVEDLRTDFLSKTMENCISFIQSSQEDQQNWNLAIADENDEYLGTVSLKNIKEDSAEFGITIRKTAMGKGYALTAMKQILDRGFEELGISKIYWCVSPKNQRAVRFYDKNGFQRTALESLKMIEGYTKDQMNSYIWYCADREKGYV